MTVSVCLQQKPPQRSVATFLSYFLLTPFACDTQRSMEDGDVIDAHLQQARAHLLLIVSARLHVCLARRWLTRSPMICSCLILRVESTRIDVVFHWFFLV